MTETWNYEEEPLSEEDRQNQWEEDRQSQYLREEHQHPITPAYRHAPSDPPIYGPFFAPHPMYTQPMYGYSAQQTVAVPHQHRGENQHQAIQAYESVPNVAPFFIPFSMAQPGYRSYDPMYDGYGHQHQAYHHPNHHMKPEKKDPAEHKRYMYDLCQRYQYYLVQCECSDGQVYDGIIDYVDDEGVYMLEPVGDMEREEQDDMNRQFAPGFGFGFPRRFRRFRRRHFPFFFLRRLFFPFFY